MKTFIFSAFLFLLYSSAFAQDPLKGFVGEKDEKGNEHPLVGVDAYWLGTSRGTITDMNGFFTLPFVKESTTLVIHCIGYHPDTLAITSQHTVRIFLVAEAHTVGDVNVVGERAGNISGLLKSF